MAAQLHHGRVHRRCGCRDTDGRQLGPHCPKLQGHTRHGLWAYAVDLPSVDGRRTTRRRCGFPTRVSARAALEQLLTSEHTGVFEDPTMTVATYLTEWLRTKQDTLRPTTHARYRDHVHKNLVPAFGR